MKYSNLLLIAVLLLSLASCKKQVQPANEINFPGSLALNKLESFDIDGETLTCSLDSVLQDSRCPINANCVWQGMAVARFNVSHDNTQSAITLGTIKFGPYDTNSTVAGFKIELVGVSPYPELGKPANYNDYVAKVKITKL